MKVFNKEINNRYALWIILNFLIVIDIIFITLKIFFNFSPNIKFYFQSFDFILCIILLVQWFYVFHISKPKKYFLKQKSNWIDLIASIPFDVVLPVVIPQLNLLRFLRLLRLLRVFALFNKFFDSLERFIKISNIDKIVGGVFFTIIIFTLVLFIYGPTYGLFDDFYFVIVTLSTVGYGDIYPRTFTEKIISICLIIAGIFIFSTITAAISSYFTDKLLNRNDEVIEDNVIEAIENKSSFINEEVNNIKKELDLIHKENKELKQEISELKELIKLK